MSSKDKRKLAAIMFADVVGYSRMMANNEERTLELLKDFENICSPIISDSEGKIIKKVGDELFCEFSSAKQAVDCSLKIQKTIQPYNDSRPKDFKLQVRIGIHVGDIVLRDGDVFGDGVNVASRIQPFSNPGGICISNAVKESISSHPNYNIISEGQQDLKNIIEKYTLYRVETGYETVAKNRKKDKPKEEKTNKWIKRFLMFIGFIVIMNLLMWFVNWNFKNTITTFESSISNSNPDYERATFLGDIHNSAISPDGEYIVFETKEDIMIQDINNVDNPIKLLSIESNDDIENLRWSTDGEKVFISGRFGGYAHDGTKMTKVIHKLGGSIQRLPYHTTSSPNGELGIGYWVNYKSLYIRDLYKDEIIETVNLNSEFTWLYDVRWSPKQNLILYQTSTGNQFTFWTKFVNNQNENKLFTEKSNTSLSVWSPNGDAFYYLVSTLGNQKSDLRKITIDIETGTMIGDPKTLVKGVTSGIDVMDRENHLSISKEGKILIIDSDDYSSNLFSAIPINKDDSTYLKTTQLTNRTNKIFGHSISPDEKMIAFSLVYSKSSNIYTMPINGGGKTQITFFDSSYCLKPAWSPNGAEITFIAENKNNFELWKVNLISGKTHQYHVDNLSGDSHYVYWPFANQIIYNKKGSRNFNILNTSSGEQKKLITNEQGWLWGPIYSPDKKKLAVKYNYCMDCESDNRYMKQGLWIIPNQDSLIEDKIRFIKGPYISPVSWSKNSELIYGWDHNDNKIYSFQEETGSMLDSISLPPLTKQVSIISDGQSFILDIGTESRYDLWYLTNFE